MKVSILVPIYGVERYIEQCVHTLMQQTYKDIEYVFVNDCTPDNSIDILKNVIEQYPERVSQVRIINHVTNQGLASTRQTALDAATGNSVLFIDSDDYILTDTVERLVDEMLTSHADIVDGGYSIVVDGVVVRNYVPLHVSSEAYLKIMLCQNVVLNSVVGRLINRSLFSSNGISFIHGVDYGEDYSVVTRIMAEASRSWVDTCFYFYRTNNPQSYTNNITTKNAISFFKCQQIVGSFFCSDTNLKHYRFASEIGWVNVWRFARRFGLSKELVDEHFKLMPSHLVTRMLTSLMKSVIPYSVVNFCYKAVRTIYIKSLR